MEIIRVIVIVGAVIGITFGLCKLFITIPRETKREFDKIDKENKK